MHDKDTISRRIIDRAAELFAEDNTLRDGTEPFGLLTTTHYAMAVREEFGGTITPLDSATCREHLSQMGDIVNRVGADTWQRADAGEAVDRAKAGIMRIFDGGRQVLSAATLSKLLGDHVVVNRALRDLMSEGMISQQTRLGPELFGLEAARRDRFSKRPKDKIEEDVLRLLAGDESEWWSIETVTGVLMRDGNPHGGQMENLVGLALYTMATDGRIATQRNIWFHGERTTMFIHRDGHQRQH